MSTFREVIYMINDELKLLSDDSFYTEDHLIFLAGKYRTFLLKQRYSDIKKVIPESNFSTICLNLNKVPAISGEPCEGGYYLKSVEKVPYMMGIKTPRVFPIDYYQGEITYISRDRMRYTGCSKYLTNIIYCSLGPDNHLYFKSSNPQFLYLKNVRVNAVFADIEDIIKLKCDDSICELLDMEFPLEAALIPPLIELIVKELGHSESIVEDDKNDAKDDLPNINNR